MTQKPVKQLRFSIQVEVYRNQNKKNYTSIVPIEKLQFQDGVITVTIKPCFLKHNLLLLKYHISNQFEILTCISAVDYPSKKYRFKIIYELLSIRYNVRLRIKLQIDELTTVDSCDKLFLTAGWYECEIWDMFGIFFKNHTNLKRILTDYGFEGYPLRKDFPLSGFIEMRYNDIQKRVINESIEFCQEYRTFSFISPWVKSK